MNHCFARRSNRNFGISKIFFRVSVLDQPFGATSRDLSRASGLPLAQFAGIYLA